MFGFFLGRLVFSSDRLYGFSWVVFVKLGDGGGGVDFGVWICGARCSFVSWVNAAMGGCWTSERGRYLFELVDF